MASDVTLSCILFNLLMLCFMCRAEEVPEEELRLVTRPLYLDDNWYFELIEPEEIGYTYKIRPAKDFGSVLNRSFSHIDLVPSQPIHACSDISNKLMMRGNIALIERGGCSFLSKTLQAEQAGAMAIIICDHNHENDNQMVDMIQDDTQRTTSLPAFFLQGKDGFMIQQMLQNTGLQSAIINIPVNATGIPVHQLNQPPWTLW